MKNLVSLVCLLLICSCPVTAAYKSFCSDDWACAGAEKNASGEINYWMENQKPYPITMTLTVRTSNLKSITGEVKRKWEITRVIAGQERLQVLQLRKVQDDKLTRDRFEFDWIPGDKNAQHDEQYRYTLPFAPNRDYRVVQGFNGNYSHRGASRYALDFAMPIGSPIHAARAGVVIDLESGNWQGGASRRFAKYANYIVLLHDDGTTGEYYHLKQHGVAVSLGESVSVGQLIGYSGNTGFSSLPHLHFAVYKARSHGQYQSLPIQFNRPLNTWKRRGLGLSD
ncbi:M23 family metallopeptidase [Planctobacterium marinum]|uniref:M23 family metallopeptidase n=1 Tax=Planctobacterium marinum TaxID=1631968 RepID=UPI001E5DE975|nr:M23 family metallopeptidase [Planctobacterium marinum]MCC2607421.1 M23 family metallopeptidase [Planctobacterium marinum]